MDGPELTDAGRRVGKPGDLRVSYQTVDGVWHQMCCRAVADTMTGSNNHTNSGHLVLLDDAGSPFHIVNRSHWTVLEILGRVPDDKPA